MTHQDRALTADEARAVDQRLRERFGISTLVLMENAGRAVADEALAMIGSNPHVAVFCGKGNNGGDGFVAARHLLTRGIRPDVFIAGKAGEVKHEARTNLDILLKFGQKVAQIDDGCENLLCAEMSRYGLVIDALLGVGLAGEVRGLCRDIIDMINHASAHVLAVDIPSGLDATTGRVLGACIEADRTVTFIAKKRGMAFADGPKMCGEVVVADLGVPPELIFIEK